MSDIASDVTRGVSSFLVAARRTPPADDVRWSPQSIAFRLSEEITVLARAFRGRYIYIFMGEDGGTRHGNLITMFDFIASDEFEAVHNGHFAIHLGHRIIDFARRGLHLAGIASIPRIRVSLGMPEVITHTLWNPTGAVVRFHADVYSSASCCEEMLVMSPKGIPYGN